MYLHLSKVACIKLRSNAGNYLNDSQILFLCYGCGINYFFIKKMLDKGYQMIWFEIEFYDSIEPKLIAWKKNDSMFFESKYNKIPEVLKAQISIIESYKIPKRDIDINKSLPADFISRVLNGYVEPEVIDHQSDVKLDMDSILDKINKSGIESLLKAEKRFLKNLSKEFSSEMENNSETDNNLSDINNDNLLGRILNNSDVLLSFNSALEKCPSNSHLPNISELMAIYALPLGKKVGMNIKGIFWSSEASDAGTVIVFDMDLGTSFPVPKTLGAFTLYMMES